MTQVHQNATLEVHQQAHPSAPPSALTGARQLTVIDGESLLALDVEPPRFIVANLIPTGLHLLAGSPKIGKSWLALWLCHQVSSGGKVWEFDTQKCGTLYISLEDTLDRLHLRLSRIADNGSKDTLFATAADNLSTGLLEQLEAFVATYPDTGLIVIDTFQRIRDGESESTYASDYREVVKIKALADKHKIAVMLIHHLRKAPDSDPFNMVSGSTGIIGAVDSIYVLEKQKRVENAAILHITGRDIEDLQIKLSFERDPPVWKFVEYGSGEKKGVDPITPALCGFMAGRTRFVGTASELFAALCGGGFGGASANDGVHNSSENDNENGNESDNDSKTALKSSGITPNNLSRKIKEHLLTLEKSHNIKASFERKNTARLIILEKVTNDSGFAGVDASLGDGDGGDGRVSGGAEYDSNADEGVSRETPSLVMYGQQSL